MNLISGRSPWSSASSSTRISRPLDRDLSTDVLVVGSGVVGAMVADALSREGVETIVVDRHEPGHGSTQASTALVQYDLDVPLFRLIERMPNDRAVRAFKLGVDSIDELEVRSRGLDVGFHRKRSLYVASHSPAAAELRGEFETRKSNGFDVEWVDADDLRSGWGLQASAAIVSEKAAEVDPVRLTDALLKESIERGVEVFDHADVVEIGGSDRFVVRTKVGAIIRCRYVVHAGGYEAAKLLPPGSCRLFATFACLGKPPSSTNTIWSDRSLLWEFANPYLYARWVGDQVMVGGEDVPQGLADDCSALLEPKTAALKSKFDGWFPSQPLEIDSSWCGVVATTSDGLGFIGPVDEGSRILLALCYGGNGMTHGIAASRIIADAIKGRKNADAEIFRVRRFA